MQKNNGRPATPADLTCQEFVELVTDYLENALPPELRERLESHLELCDGCKLYLGQMRLSVRALHREPHAELPPVLREQIMEHFRHHKD